MHSCDSLLANIDLPQEQIADDSQDRHGDDDSDPSDPRRGISMRPDHHSKTEYDLNCYVNYHHGNQHPTWLDQFEVSWEVAGKGAAERSIERMRQSIPLIEAPGFEKTIPE
jgi:hypothetical protein